MQKEALGVWFHSETPHLSLIFQVTGSMLGKCNNSSPFPWVLLVSEFKPNKAIDAHFWNTSPSQHVLVFFSQINFAELFLVITISIKIFEILYLCLRNLLSF